jgi:alpha-L-rhamnosidase
MNSYNGGCLNDSAAHGYYQENLIQNATNTAGGGEGLAQCDEFKDWLCGNHQSCCTGEPEAAVCPVGPEMAGFNYVLGLRAMAQMAAALGNATSVARYSGFASSATRVFHETFYNPVLQQYGGDIGAVQSLTTPAIAIGAAPTPDLAASAVQTLQDDLAENTNFTLRVGAVTSKILLNVLSESGHHETALRAATTTAEDSWGYWWANNATTCYESWPINQVASGTEPVGTPPPGTIGINPRGTLNHIFLCGGIGHWMWKHLVGLTPAAPGFAEVSIAPKVHDVFGPRSVGGEFLSPRGTIASSWRLDSAAGTVSLRVSLPVGVGAATITVPKPTTAGKPAAAAVVRLHGAVVWDGTKLVGEPAGIVGAVDTPDGVAFSTTNGAFAFESQNHLLFRKI